MNSPEQQAGDGVNRLIDPFDRTIEYIRLSVTDKCNLRCFYCLPKHFRGFEQPSHWLTFDEIERVIGAFAASTTVLSLAVVLPEVVGLV